MSLMGRPFWWTGLGAAAADGLDPIWTQGVLMIQRKLSLPMDSSATLTNVQAVALMGILLAVDVGARSEWASQMAARHLRIVAGISKDRESVLTVNVAEPLLALAVWDFLRSRRVTWAQLLSAFCTEEVRSHTSVGFRGELGAQILLLLASTSADLGRVATFDSFAFLPLSDFVLNMIGTRHEIVRNHVDNLNRKSRDLLRGLLKLEEVASASSQMCVDLMEFLARFAHAEHFVETFLGQTTMSSRQIRQTLRTSYRHLLTAADNAWYEMAIKFAALVASSGWESTEEELKLAEDFDESGESKESVVRGIEYAALRKSLEVFAGDATISRSRVRFFQFIKVHTKKFTKAMLLDFYIRGAAIQCAENQSVIDMVIPTCRLGPQDEVKEEDMAAIVIQARLRQDGTKETVKQSWFPLAVAEAEIPVVLAVFVDFGDVNVDQDVTTAVTASLLFGPIPSPGPVTRKRVFDGSAAPSNSSYGLAIDYWRPADIRNQANIQGPFNQLLKSLVEYNHRCRGNLELNHTAEEIADMLPYIAHLASTKS